LTADSEAQIAGDEMDQVLCKINNPSDIRKLSLEEISILGKEIRELIVQVVSVNGGHLASNLGVVELTMALHAIFESPNDKFIWDVGHQSYVHKILTGRYQSLSSLRQADGISGFPKRIESEHDAFDTGHSSTSISAALGFAYARDLKGEKHHVIAIIGDGSMTGGLAYEGLNNAGHSSSKIIVILNDNNMSISENVGSMASYLSKLRTAPTYFRIKSDIEYILKRIPNFGEKMLTVAERVKDSLKYLLTMGIVFEEMGFTYLGPIDGHNYADLTTVIQRAKNINGPVLVHVLTKKGRGYTPAEKNPDRFHATAPFSLDTGDVLQKNALITYTEAFGNAIVDAAEKDPRVIGITAAMPEGTGMDKLKNHYPERFVDVGIAESHGVTFAAGLAAAGMKPVVGIYSTFLQRAYDQIISDVCLQNLPVVFAVDRAGIVGEDGETHQGIFDLSYLRSMPNMIIMAPKDENELQHLLHSSLEYNCPVAIRYPRGLGQGVPIEQIPRYVPIGESELLRSGDDFAIFALGPAVNWAMEAAEILFEYGINVTVVNARFVKPLDGEMLRSLGKRCKNILIIEENVQAGGLYSAVCEYFFNHDIHDVSLISLAIPNKFIPQGKRDKLLKQMNLCPEGIADLIMNKCGPVSEVNRVKKSATIHLVR
jgi:1-deoxy-D-xylulose-5-phosphate synthase